MAEEPHLVEEDHSMADWRKLAKSLALADGRIDTKESNIIKQELWADGKLDKSELEFLLDVKKSAQSVVREFNVMLFTALKAAVLADGDISAKEANWLRKFLYADGKIDDDEKRFLQELKAGAKSTCPEFEELYKQAVGA
jgi:tellurite resistance protein